MKSKFPKGVMLVDDWGDSIAYRCSCDCGESSHDVYIEFEYDKDLQQMLFLNFYKDVYFFDSFRRDVLWFDDIIKKVKEKKFKEAISDFFDDTLFYYWRNFRYRLRKAVRILFTGYLEMNEDFILRGVDHIDNFIKVLEEGRDLILEREREGDKHESKT